MGPSSAAMFDCVTKAAPAITPAIAASAVPRPNTIMNTRGTLWPSMPTMFGCVSDAWMMRPARVRVSSKINPMKIRIENTSMKVL